MSFGSFVPGVSQYEKEARRWDTTRSQGGMRPDHFEEYPKMVYRARRPDSGGQFVVTIPGLDAWSEQNCLKVGNRHEEERALGDGWRNTPQEAIAHANALDEAISNAAAERAMRERGMGEKARAEAALVDAATFEHVPEITPAAVSEAKKRRGRPPKNVA